MTVSSTAQPFAMAIFYLNFGEKLSVIVFAIIWIYRSCNWFVSY